MGLSGAPRSPALGVIAFASLSHLGAGADDATDEAALDEDAALEDAAEDEAALEDAALDEDAAVGTGALVGSGALVGTAVGGWVGATVAVGGGGTGVAVGAGAHAANTKMVSKTTASKTYFFILLLLRRFGRVFASQKVQPCRSHPPFR
jgi:hypothetical protein